MKRFALFLAVICTLCAPGCTRTATSTLAPDATAASAAANVVYDSSVQWDATQIGRVTVTNPRSTPLVLTFMLWDYRSEWDQTSVSAAVYTLPAHATQVLTVGTKSTACRIQRDLYEGSFKAGVSLADVASALYAGGGVIATGCRPPSDPPVVPPPPPPPPPVGMCPADVRASVTRAGNTVSAKVNGNYTGLVSLVSYIAPSAVGNRFPQERYQEDVQQVTPGAMSFFHVELPACGAWQWDIVCGLPEEHLVEASYGDRKIAYDFAVLWPCVEHD